MLKNRTNRRFNRFAALTATFFFMTSTITHASEGWQKMPETLTDAPTGGVEFDGFSGFRIFQCNPADGWEGVFAFVGEKDSSQVVPAVGAGESAEDGVATRLLGIGQASVWTLEEIGDEEHDRLALEETVHVVERVGQVRAFSLWLEVENFPDDAEDVVATLARGHVGLDPVGEDEQADLVVIPAGGKGEHTGDFRGQLPLGFGGGPK